MSHTPNRFNDRWPFLLASNFLAFSMWSANPEVIAPDETDIVPWDKDLAAPDLYPRPRVDAWLGAFVQPGGGQFGGLLKPGVPVWRPRPLFNGRIVFQTRFLYPQSEQADNFLYEVVQAEPGLLLHSPSADTGVPRPVAEWLRLGPTVSGDDAALALALATPSPSPDGHVVLAAIELTSEQGVKPDARRYGIWMCRDDWDAAGIHQLTADQSEMKRLFDDPALVDAEPAAVYARHFERFMDAVETPPAGEPPPIHLASGGTYTGPSGTLFGSSLYAAQFADAPGQLAAGGSTPHYVPPPPGSLDHMRIYASHRDRFDDSQRPRVPGKFELLFKAPVTGATFGAQVPAGIPTVLAGFDRNGRVLSWEGPNSSRFFAFAGDHYSAARLGGKHFCVGCHPGHSGLRPEDHRHHERLR